MSKKPQKPQEPKSEAQAADEVNVPIEFHFPADDRAQFSNYVTVQRDLHEFHLSFFDVRPPLFIGPEEKVREQSRQLTSIRAECIARIVVSAARIPSLIAALQNQYANYITDNAASEAELRGDQAKDGNGHK